MPLVDTPIFLVGCERSGTTLLRLMLDHHPRIAFNNESEYLVTQISDEGAHPTIDSYREYLKHHRIFQNSRFVIDEGLDYAALVNSFLIQKRLRDNKELVGATVHYQFGKLGRIWSRAKYIYLYRDGRDVAHSVMKMGWAGNVYVAADWWLKAEEEWWELRSRLSEDLWIEVRYEDLIADTKRELERISAFLGVAYDDKMLNYVRTSTYQAPDVSLIHQWKTGMRASNVQQIEAKLGRQLLKRGYELSDYPKISISGFMMKYLYLQSRMNTFLFRLRRYGFGLTLQETLSRRLGMSKMHQKAVHRINHIVNASRK